MIGTRNTDLISSDNNIITKYISDYLYGYGIGHKYWMFILEICYCLRTNLFSHSLKRLVNAITMCACINLIRQIFSVVLMTHVALNFLVFSRITSNGTNLMNSKLEGVNCSLIFH